MNTESNIHQSRDTAIRLAQARVIERMNADPAAARCKYLTRGKIGHGLACEITQGRFSTTTDLGRGMGGDALGPSPGFFARAAICGCVASSIKMLSAREGLVLASVDVSVETDMDDSALFGLGTFSAAPIHTDLAIVIDSQAGEAAVQSVVARAVGMATWYLALAGSKAVTIRHDTKTGGLGKTLQLFEVQPFRY